MSRISLASAALLVPLAGACAWVELERGESVRVGTPAQVERCEKLGASHGKTAVNIGPFSRRQAKIEQELEFLARNEAAEMGGDTVVPQGPASAEGRRSYDVYRCSGDY